jgi:hypothetical protein
MSVVKEEWIAELASTEESERQHGASQIFTAGRSRAFSIVQGWLVNEELRRLLGDAPEVTVGLAVRPETFAKIREANGWPRLAEVPEEQDASEFELRFAEPVALDVLTSPEPEGAGAIAKFLVKFGEDVQQVELRCNDVDRATVILREQFAMSAVYPETLPGADGTRVNFFLVAGAEDKRVLIELYQPASAGSEGETPS